MFWSVYLYQTLLFCNASWVLFSGLSGRSWGDFWSFAFKGCCLFSSRDTDVHTVASLLKLYLRDLPEPVVPWSQYEGFLLCGQLMNADEAKVGISLELGVLLGKKVMVTERYSGGQGTVCREVHACWWDTLSNRNFTGDQRQMKPIMVTAFMGCNNPIKNCQIPQSHFKVSKRWMMRMHLRRVSSSMALLGPTGTQGQAAQFREQMRGLTVLAPWWPQVSDMGIQRKHVLERGRTGNFSCSFQLQLPVQSVAPWDNSSSQSFVCVFQ